VAKFRKPRKAGKKTDSDSLAQPIGIDHIIETYGDLIYDLCETILWSSNYAQIAFKTIMKEIKKNLKLEPYQKYERTWILGIVHTKLLALSKKYGKNLSPAEKIMLDQGLDSNARLQQFESYFHRLSIENQVLLLLRDKYTIPYDEIAGAFNCPVGSLKISRQQSLRALEEWVWNE